MKGGESIPCNKGETTCKCVNGEIEEVKEGKNFKDINWRKLSFRIFYIP